MQTGEIQVGDLVRCTHAGGLVGLVAKKKLNAHNSLVYVVLVGGSQYPFRAHQLEVISAGR